MKKILIITASARVHDSVSRYLSNVFINHWEKSVPNSIITIRELANSNVSHLTEKWLVATSKSASERSHEEIETLKYSSDCIQELFDADIIVIATPMYNFSIPSALKAYIDQIMRVNETFSVQNKNGKQIYSGLLKGKSLLLLLSRGGQDYEKDEENAELNYQNTYLKMVFGIMGIQNVSEIIINGTSRKNEFINESIMKAELKIQTLIEQVVGDHEK